VTATNFYATGESNFATSGGSVGIRNTNASSFNAGANQLVVGSGSTTQGITVYSSSTTDGNIYFANGTSGSNAFNGALGYNHASKFMFFATNGGVEKMRITSGGNVLVGTTTDAGFKLDVNGTARVQGEMTVKTMTVGRGAGDIATNTAVGVSALAANTTGNDNSAFGDGALRKVTTGVRNSSFGSSSSSEILGGTDNSAFGARSMQSNTSGSFNVAFGASSLLSNSTASRITAIGMSSLLNNTTGANNTALGFNAGRYADSGTTANQTSSNSIYVGYQSRAGANGNTNEIVIGYDVVGNGSNTTTLGNASTTNNYIYGNFNIIDKDIILGTTTGTKIGTATTQKLSLWNATPDVQPTTAITAAAFVANTSGIVDDTATFGGYTLGQIVAALKRIGALA
jgi:hypothetical protein